MQSGNKAIQFIVFILGAMLTFFMIVSVMSGAGNNLGKLASYLVIFGGIFGLFMPRMAFFYLIILAGYSDLIKRLMILDNSVNMLDITNVLAMAPVCLAGIVAGTFGAKVIGGKLKKRDFVLLIVATAMFFLAVVRAYAATGGMFQTLRIAATEGAYAYLIFVVPILFNTKEKIAGVLKFIVIAFVPVALYGIYQGIFGLTRWEEAYLLTGYSNEIRQLFDVHPRPFSTLNAATSLTLAMAYCSFLTIYLARQRGSGSVKKVMSLGSIALLICFLSCMIATLTRMGWLAFAVGIFAMIMLSRPWSTKLFYFGGVAAVITLVLSAGFLLDNLHSWQNVLGGLGSNKGDMIFRITTWSDRLIGLNNLATESELWRPFGVDKNKLVLGAGQGRYDNLAFSHDGLSTFIYNKGYVPFAIVCIVGAFGLTAVHKRIHRLEPHDRRNCVMLLAMLWGLGSAGASAGTILVFPINIFIWLTVGSLILILGEASASVKKLAPRSVPQFREKRKQFHGIPAKS